MKNQFDQASRRDKEAAAYFSSEKFLDACLSSLKIALVERGQATAAVHSDVAAKPQDMPYIKAAFNKLKKEYPELNHIRPDDGNCIILDTKPNTVLRRITHALSKYAAGP